MNTGYLVFSVIYSADKSSNKMSVAFNDQEFRCNMRLRFTLVVQMALGSREKNRMRCAMLVYTVNHAVFTHDHSINFVLTNSVS